MARSSFSQSNLFAPSAPTPLQRFLVSPLQFLSKWLYTYQPPIISPSPGPSPIRLVCISDTHNLQPLLPHGDILIHAGDLTINGTARELEEQIAWLNGINGFQAKVVIAGNHDVYLSKEKVDVDWGSITYLQNSSTTVSIRRRELNIYASPMTPKYGNWPFQYSPAEARSAWENKIPDDTDILVTHGPARGHVDAEAPAAGCVYLLREVRRVKPRLHVCGHIHKARGVEVVDWGRVQRFHDRFSCGEGGVFMLASMCAAWVWEWVRYVFGGRREGKGLFVNAAMREGEIEGRKDGVVIEL